MDYILFIIIIIASYFFGRERGIRKDISIISALTSETSAHVKRIIEDINYLKARHAVLEAQNQAIVKALSRIHSFDELMYINLHYECIMQLFTLRSIGNKEETIVRELMNYKNGAHGRGWSMPCINQTTMQKEIILFSPYYVATRGINFSEVNRMVMQQDGFIDTPGLLWSEEHARPEIPRREMPVYYTNDDGELIEYPSHA